LRNLPEVVRLTRLKSNALRDGNKDANKDHKAHKEIKDDKNLDK
jgi:hypothetical protein